MDKETKNKVRESCEEELGHISAIFMSQGDVKAGDIIMPTEELVEALDRFELYLFEALQSQTQDTKNG